MKILSVQIERSSADQQYCGTLDYTDFGRIGTLLWSVEASNLKIEVSFLQGSDEHWDAITNKHASYLSDNLILEIARRLDAHFEALHQRLDSLDRRLDQRLGEVRAKQEEDLMLLKAMSCQLRGRVERVERRSARGG